MFIQKNPSGFARIERKFSFVENKFCCCFLNDSNYTTSTENEQKITTTNAVKTMQVKKKHSRSIADLRSFSEPVPFSCYQARVKKKWKAWYQFIQ